MPPEELPIRQTRGNFHIPPQWVDHSAVFFITINCSPRGGNFLTTGNTPDKIFESVNFLRDRREWHPEMVLLMPDHLHALISFSWEKNQGMNRLLSDWKRFTATKLGIPWQRDYFDHRIRSEEDHQATWFYIRENPVRASLVDTYDKWPHVWLSSGIGWNTRQGPISERSGT